jgi:dimethylamine/trimethylamine dehydrogenase
VSHFTHNTLEQERIQTRLLELGVGIRPLHTVSSAGNKSVSMELRLHGPASRRLPAHLVIPVTMRRPVDALYHELLALIEGSAAASPKVGDPHW